MQKSIEISLHHWEIPQQSPYYSTSLIWFWCDFGVNYLWSLSASQHLYGQSKAHNFVPNELLTSFSMTWNKIYFLLSAWLKCLFYYIYTSFLFTYVYVKTIRSDYWSNKINEGTFLFRMEISDLKSAATLLTKYCTIQKLWGLSNKISYTLVVYWATKLQEGQSCRS